MNLAAVSGSFECATAARSGSDTAPAPASFGPGAAAMAHNADDTLVGVDRFGVRGLVGVLPLVGLLSGLILITAGCGPPS